MKQKKKKKLILEKMWYRSIEWNGYHQLKVSEDWTGLGSTGDEQAQQSEVFQCPPPLWKASNRPKARMPHEIN